MVLASLVPKNGNMEYLMWDLLFIKSYPKKQIICVLVQVNDPKTYRKRIWSFIVAIADLIGEIVSSLGLLFCLNDRNILPLFFLIRSNLKIILKMI